MRSCTSRLFMLLILVGLVGCSGTTGSSSVQFSDSTEQLPPGINTGSSTSAGSEPGEKRTNDSVLTADDPSVPDVPLSAPITKAIGLQLGAFGSAESAARHLRHLKRSYPLLFEGRSPIVRTRVVGQRTLYRVLLGPFSSTELAEEFCDQLKGRSEGCFAAQYDRIDQNITN